MDRFKCITKEAELMIEWLREGSSVPYEEYTTCYEIRECALELAMFEGDWSIHLDALLLVRVCLPFSKENSSVHM